MAREHEWVTWGIYQRVDPHSHHQCPLDGVEEYLLKGGLKADGIGFSGRVQETMILPNSLGHFCAC